MREQLADKRRQLANTMKRKETTVIVSNRCTRVYIYTYTTVISLLLRSFSSLPYFRRLSFLTRRVDGAKAVGLLSAPTKAEPPAGSNLLSKKGENPRDARNSNNGRTEHLYTGHRKPRQHEHTDVP